MKAIIFVITLLIFQNFSLKSQSLRERIDSCKNPFDKQNAKSLNSNSPKLSSLFTHSKEITDCIIGIEAPDFEVITVNREKLNLKQLRGKVIVLNFWFYACKPCIAEIPALNQLVENYQNKEVIFIALSRDSQATLEKYFSQKYDFHFKIVSDAQEIIEEKYLNYWGYPTTIIIDKLGKIHKILSGGFMEGDIKQKTVDKITPFIENCLK